MLTALITMQSASQKQIHPKALLRLDQVLELVPVSQSSWWAGVKTGRFPKAVKLGPKTTCWRAADIFALIDAVDR
jgi:prophage regulatory protein